MIDQVREALRRASKAVEAPRRRTEDVVRKLAENPDFDLLDASGMARDLLRLGKEQAGKARSVVDDQLRRRLNDLGLATREEVEQLQRRIAELEANAGPAPAAGIEPHPAGDFGADPAPPRRPRTARAQRAPAARPAARGRAGATPTPAAATPPAPPTATAAKRSPARKPATTRAPARKPAANGATAGGSAPEAPEGNPATE